MTYHARAAWRRHLATIGHYLTAAVLLLKGMSYVGQDAPPWGFVAMCFAASALIASITLLHHRIEPRFPFALGVIYLTECAVCAVLAFRTHSYGKVGLPIAWSAAALIIGLLGLVELKKASRPRGGP